MKEIKQDIKTLLSRVDLRLVGLLVVLGLTSALVIQGRFAPQEFLGAFFITVLLMGVLYRDIMRYRPHYIDSFKMLALLGALVVGMLALGRLSEYAIEGLARGLEFGLEDAVYFALPLAAGAMLVTLMFDFHTALVFSVALGLLAGLWHGDVNVSAYVFVGSLVGAFSVIRCKKRTAILQAGIYLLLANMAGVIVIMLLEGNIASVKTFVGLGLAAISAITVVAFVSLALPVMEAVLKVTTDISLLELIDLDQPIMKKLMIETPGTYHHSIIVGNLVESVSESVGVNPLFARVGAYYHDIGKLKMPEYFIENQHTGVNKHEKLNPHMSSMILVSHVKEGVDLARHHGLPESVIDIIRQHHGSTLITYFYEKAKEMPGDEELSEQEYRYPGPKPQGRVAAIIMIADAVEAASRVLTEPTPARIEALVDKIVDRIFLAGQLDECDLTIKDIYEIRKRFTYTLTGIFHKRINYPGFNFNKDGDDDDGSTGRQQPEEGKAGSGRDKERRADSAKVAGASKGRA